MQVKLLLALMAVVGVGLGQEGSEQANAGAPAAQAPVVLDGRVLFTVRGVTSFPADKRAQGIMDRLLQVAGDAAVQPESLRVEEEEGMSRILAGPLLVMAVLDADSALEGVPRRVLAAAHRAKMVAAIRQYRDERHPRELAKSALVALAALLVAAALLFVVSRLFRRLGESAERFSRSKIEQAPLPALEIVQRERFWSTLRSGVHAVRALAMVLVVFLAAEFVLGQFPWTRPAATRLLSIVLDPLRRIGMGIVGWLPSLVFLLVLGALVRFALKVMRLYFEAIEHGTVTLAGFDREWAMPTFRIVRLLLVAFALVVAYPYLPGSETDAFKGVSLFLGVIFSLGSSSALANLIAGYSLTYRRAFKVGDRVAIGDVKGTVTHARLQATHLRTVKNEEVVIPNSLILASAVVNYSRLAKERGLILHTTVGIGYETSWRQVEAMLQMAAERTEGLLREPPPFVLEKELGDFAVVYELNVHIDEPHSSERLYAALHQNILDVFNEYGVQIMTPAYEGDPEQAKLVPREKWFDAPARRADLEMRQDIGESKEHL